MKKTNKKKPLAKTSTKKSKKVVAKKAQKKPTPQALKVSIPPRAPVPTRLQAPTKAPAPTRAPARKIIGADRSVTIVEKASPEPLPEPTPVVAKLKLVPEVVPALPLEPNIPWNSLPSHFPPQLQFLLSIAEKECEAAATWPLPFAKFLSTLPQEICGKGLSLLILGLTQKSTEIAEQCSMKPQEIEAHLARTSEVLEERFSTLCKDMYRKLKVLLSDSSKSVASIVEAHLVPKVNKDFQTLVGELLLKSLAGQESFVIAGKLVREKVTKDSSENKLLGNFS